MIRLSRAEPFASVRKRTQHPIYFLMTCAACMILNCKRIIPQPFHFPGQRISFANVSDAMALKSPVVPTPSALPSFKASTNKLIVTLIAGLFATSTVFAETAETPAIVKAKAKAVKADVNAEKTEVKIEVTADDRSLLRGTKSWQCASTHDQPVANWLLRLATIKQNILSSKIAR